MMLPNGESRYLPSKKQINEQHIYAFQASLINNYQVHQIWQANSYLDLICFNAMKSRSHESKINLK